MTKTAIIYARVSSPGQADQELPVQSQLEVCYRKADEIGAQVVRVFVDDGLSGRTDRRPEFQAAVRFCRESRIDLFICWSTSRFFRNREEAPTYKRQLREAGTQIIYVSQNIDRTRKDGWLMEGFYELIDDHRSREISEDTMRSMMRNAREGHWNGGRLPFGYRSVADGKRRRLAIHDDEALTVRAIFAECISGAGARTIVQHLNAAGMLKRGRPWDRAAVHYLLRNRVYTGVLTYHRHDVANRAIRPRDEWIETAAHPPIIPVETWEKVQQILAARAPERVGGSPRSRHLFTGLLRCGACGSSMQIETATGRSRTYSYYSCRKALNSRACEQKRIPAPALDAWLSGWIVDRLLAPAALSDIAGQLAGNVVAWRDTAAARSAAVKAQLHDAERRRRRLLDLVETADPSAPSVADLTPRLRELNAQVEALRMSLDREAFDAGVGQIDLTAINFDQLAAAVREIVQGDDPVPVREYLSAVLESVVIERERVRFVLRPDWLIGPVHNGGNSHPNFPPLRTALVAVLPEAFRVAA